MENMDGVDFSDLLKLFLTIFEVLYFDDLCCVHQLKGIEIFPQFLNVTGPSIA
jgi:hypothetical protein